MKESILLLSMSLLSATPGLAEQTFRFDADKARAQVQSILVDTKSTKLDGTLNYLRLNKKSSQSLDSGLSVVGSSTLPDGRVLVKITPVFGVKTASLAKRLAGKIQITGQSADSIEGYIQPQVIDFIAGQPDVAAMTNVVVQYHAGQFLTEGYVPMRVDELHDVEEDYDGTGVIVGVLSNSYNCLGGEAQDKLTHDLPANSATLLENCTNGLDEARAMMQIVHDVAPGAQLLHSSTTGGINAALISLGNLVTAGAKVIVDDFSYFSEPWFQENAYMRAIEDYTKNNGITYVTAAGNLSPSTSYASPFIPSSQPSGTFGVFHQFAVAGDTNVAVVNIPPHTQTVFNLQWDQPWRTSTNPTGPASDLNLFVVNMGNGSIIAGSVANNPVTGQAMEAISLTNSGNNPAVVGILVALRSGPQPSRLQLMLVGGATFLQTGLFNMKPASIISHHNSPYAISVGAAPAQDHLNVAFYSSMGGAPYRYRLDGTPVNLVPQKPDIVGPDSVQTSFFGVDLDNDGFLNFRGTSAAAPHIAGLAAIFHQRMNNVRFDYIRDSLTKTAVDMDDPVTPTFDTGFDFATGFGFVDAMESFDYLDEDNNRPEVVLGEDLELTNADLEQVITINAQASDDGRPGTTDYDLTYHWDVTPSCTCNSNDTFTIVSQSMTKLEVIFHQAVKFKVKLTLDDSEKDKSDTINVEFD